MWFRIGPRKAWLPWHSWRQVRLWGLVSRLLRPGNTRTVFSLEVKVRFERRWMSIALHTYAAPYWGDEAN